MGNKLKFPVALRALIARINRKLAHQDEMVRVCRPNSHGWDTTGDFYRVDLRTNSIIDTYVDIEKLGRELGVLKGFEIVAEAA